MLELYRNIKKRRTELGISQQELSDKVGYSGKSMISKIERGEVDLSTTMIKKFAVALETTPFDLMGNDGINETIIEYYDNGKMLQRLLAYADMFGTFEKLSKLQPTDKEMVVNLIDSLYEKVK